MNNNNMLVFHLGKQLPGLVPNEGLAADLLG